LTSLLKTIKIKKKKLKNIKLNSHGYKEIETSFTLNSFGKNWGAKNLGKLLRILQNVIEKSSID
jgi:hypothetical protein